MLLIPLAVMLVVSAIFLSINAARMPCTPASGTHGLAISQGHSNNCPSASGSRFFGRAP
jgi:hypothetical protein